MAALADDGFHRTARMIAGTAARIERLGALPTVLLHHDLVRSNFFALPDGSTAAIDWESVGRGPLGVDLAPLISGSVRRGEGEPAGRRRRPDEPRHCSLHHLGVLCGHLLDTADAVS